MTTCVVCQRPEHEVETGQVHPGCAHRIACDLRDIADLYVRLNLLPAVNPGRVRVTGSREAPLPLAVDVLDLTMPARGGTIHDQHGDQTGYIAVASELDQWVDDWREHLNRGERRPEPPTVVVLADWLGKRLDDCLDHPAIDEFARDMRRIRQALRRVSGDGPVSVERCPAPCPRCDLMTLVKDGDEVRCRHCPERMSLDEYATWVGRLARDARMAA